MTTGRINQVTIVLSGAERRRRRSFFFLTTHNPISSLLQLDAVWIMTIHSTKTAERKRCYWNLVCEMGFGSS